MRIKGSGIKDRDIIPGEFGFRKSRSKPGCTHFCFYCGHAITAEYAGLEWDHFPIPSALGGIDVVPACTACHTIKDRLKGPAYSSIFVHSLVEDFPKFSRMTRIGLAKILRILQETSDFQSRLDSEFASEKQRNE